MYNVDMLREQIRQLNTDKQELIAQNKILKERNLHWLDEYDQLVRKCEKLEKELDMYREPIKLES
jgi:SMC interacting uncharacterized protein involved in chromosome segregation